MTVLLWILLGVVVYTAVVVLVLALCRSARGDEVMSRSAEHEVDEFLDEVLRRVA